MRLIERDGRVLHWRSDGPEDGDPILFINSLGSDLRLWDPLLQLLPRNVRAIRFDKPGHGLSEPRPAPYRMDSLVDDALAVLDAAGVRSAPVVGVSIGGMIALGMTAAAPERVEALVLLDTGPVIGDADLWNGRIETVGRDGLSAMADGILERWFAPSFREQNPSFPLWRTMLLRTSSEGYAGCCAAIRDADLTDAARSVSVSALCVAGSEDKSTPPELVQSLAQMLPDATYVEIEGSGHLPCADAPELVAQHIGTFLTRRSTSDRQAQGMGVRRAVLGDAHVDRAEAAKTAFDQDFQQFITEGAWGSVWARPGLSRRERSLLTISLLSALGHWEEVAMHARAARNTGATPDDIKEALLHVAVYAGVPAANQAFRIVKQVMNEGAGVGEDNA